MQLSEMQALIGDLTSDPNHDRYSLSQIGTELDNTQDKWNVQAKILKDTVTLTTVAGTRQYALSTLTGTPIAFSRVTHKGLKLEKRDKAWFDLYFGGTDWTTTPGTPVEYFIEATDPDLQFLTVFPTPGDGDAGANLVVEYIKKHTAMSASTDQPLNSSPLLTPYHWGMCYDTAARLLLRDPSAQNVLKIYGESKDKPGYMQLADNVMADVVQVYKAFEKEVPMRLKSISRPVGQTATSWRRGW
jgi:hypothetical protein